MAKGNHVNLLAIDTSTSSTILGLRFDDQILDLSKPAVKTHSRDILPSIQALVVEAGLELSDLDAIVFGQGPGSFTGLRIAAGVVQGLAYGLDIPVAPVSSMACLAQSLQPAGGDNKVFVALTARLEEIYFGSYEFNNGLAQSLAPEGVLDVAQLPLVPAGDWLGVGNAWQLQEKIEGSLGIKFTSISEYAEPSVRDLIALGMGCIERGEMSSALEVSPVYLREVVASKPA
jgi:tRNA threonylcarbamoyladenosine biosynthesis protein TsaB